MGKVHLILSNIHISSYIAELKRKFKMPHFMTHYFGIIKEIPIK